MNRSRYAVSTIDTLNAYLRANPSSKLKVIVDSFPQPIIFLFITHLWLRRARN